MKKILVLLFLFGFSFSVKCQIEIPGTNLTIEMVKARKIGVLSVQFAGSYNVLSGKDNKRVQVRLKVRSRDGDLTIFDPNKLSLLSDQFNARFSVSEVLFASFFQTRGFQMLTTNDTEKPVFAKYDSSVPNTFNNYTFEGYKDCSIDLNFGTNRKPIIHTIYFRPQNIDKNVLDVYFVVPNELTTGKLYFGDTLISEIDIR
ncbi:hypothetical protein [Aequorivita sp. CIP111184]|uniref:hypothetical protein n=1 Tax=Aequorivita sp. CIP111184 TaxID=2211356 RepID=UPI000DCFCCEF|nr:hypothetical protein [Aequorivita sp. CIP111184]